MMKVDLRSDTVTKPCKNMLESMLLAEVGDDVFEEDPGIMSLENYAAQLFGKEAAIFCPSGTMTNQIAIRLHTFIGAEVICHEDAHVYQYEGAGIAVNSGASVKLLKGNRGRISVSDVEKGINPDDIHKGITSLVCVEDTSNRGGGCVYDVEELKKIRSVCNDHNLPLHCDGARLFNSLVVRGDDYHEYGSLFDTISICLSKGLGAPIGSLLLGNKEHIKKARRVRKVFGGGMRQVGLLGAAGLYALKNNVERLKEDHDRAAKIESHLKELPYVDSVLPVETNIVVFNLREAVSPKSFLDYLSKAGVLAVPFGGQSIRFVTHKDFTDEHCNRLVEVLKNASF